MPNPAGTEPFITSLMAYDAAVLPSFVTTQVVSSIAPLTTSAFWIDGFCSDGILNRRVLDRRVLNRRVDDRQIRHRVVLQRWILNRRILDGRILNRRVQDDVLNRRILNRRIRHERRRDVRVVDLGDLDVRVLNRRVLDRRILDRRVAGVAVEDDRAGQAAGQQASAAPGAAISATSTRIVADGLLEVAKTLRATVENAGTETSITVSGAAPGSELQERRRPAGRLVRDRQPVAARRPVLRSAP